MAFGMLLYFKSVILAAHFALWTFCLIIIWYSGAPGGRGGFGGGRGGRGGGDRGGRGGGRGMFLIHLS
jgi:hypothetical protein